MRTGRGTSGQESGQNSRQERGQKIGQTADRKLTLIYIHKLIAGASEPLFVMHFRMLDEALQAYRAQSRTAAPQGN